MVSRNTAIIDIFESSKYKRPYTTLLENAFFEASVPERSSNTLAPAFFLAIAMAIAFRYPLTRKVHADIRRQLEERGA